jgi:hypothetical protein
VYICIYIHIYIYIYIERERERERERWTGGVAKVVQAQDPEFKPPIPSKQNQPNKQKLMYICLVLVSRLRGKLKGTTTFLILVPQCLTSSDHHLERAEGGREAIWDKVLAQKGGLQPTSPLLSQPW